MRVKVKSVGRILGNSRIMVNLTNDSHYTFKHLFMQDESEARSEVEKEGITTGR